MIEHQSISDRLLGRLLTSYGMSKTDLCLQHVSYSFILQLTKYFYLSINGAKLSIMPSNIHNDIEQFREFYSNS